MVENKAYEFWYIFNPNCRPEYVYIIAQGYQEALFLFKEAGYTKMYDFEVIPSRTIPERKWARPHRRGEILGEDAII